MNWGFCRPLSHKLHDAIFGDFGLVENGRAFWFPNVLVSRPPPTAQDISEGYLLGEVLQRPKTTGKEKSCRGHSHGKQRPPLILNLRRCNRHR